MAIVNAENVKKEYAERTLFSGVNFSIEPHDHIGLIGANGTGKTTLLKMLLREEPLDGGSLTVSSQITIAHMEQTPELSSQECLFDFVLAAREDLVRMEYELSLLPEQINRADSLERDRLIARQSRLTDQFQREDGLTYRSKTRSALIGLGFSEDEFSRPVAYFSGGQIGKAMLCRTILKKADLLLLDEPTNNLDIPAIGYLQDFLVGYKGAFLLVSHDRAFLDAVAQKIIEIENGHSFETLGNYTRHLELKSDARESARRKYAKTVREIKRIESIIEQQRRWNQQRNYVTIASKQKQIDRLKETLVPPEKDPQAVRFRFKGTEPTGNEIFSIKGLSKQYDNKEVFHDLDFIIWKGETVCIIGENGCGKSTLLKILAEELKAESGLCIKGAGVRIGYFEQNTDTLNVNNTVAEEIHYTYPRMDMSEVRGYLGCFLFRGDDINKKISVLSGGERARIKLLKLVLSGANVLLLDEPTNHFDIQSCEVMESALEQFGGTAIIVTHDRYFVERMADRVLYLKQDGVEELDLDSEDIFSVIRSTIGVKHERRVIDESANFYKRQKELKNAFVRQKQSVDKIEAAIVHNEHLLEETKLRLEQAQNTGSYDDMQAWCLKLEELESENQKLYEQLEEAENACEQLRKDLT